MLFNYIKKGFELPISPYHHTEFNLKLDIEFSKYSFSHSNDILSNQQVALHVYIALNRLKVPDFDSNKY